MIAVTLVWGATFVVVKETIREIPVYWFLFLRFALAAFLLWGFALKPAKIRTEPAPSERRGSVWLSGALLGLLLFLLYAFQTVGLLTTTASKSAFITGTTVLWTPLLTAFFLGRKVKQATILAAVMGLIGLLLLVLGGGWGGPSGQGPVIGDALTLVCAWMAAAHLIVTKRVSHRFATSRLTAIQLTTVAILSLIASFLAGETRGWNYAVSSYLAIVFLAILATSFAFWAQTRMQRFTTEERTAIIFLFEPVFAALTAYLILKERLALPQWVGAGLIFLVVLALESKFLSRRSQSSIRG